MSVMVSEVRRWINHFLFLVLTLANLTRWCWCVDTYCSHLNDKKNTTGKAGPPVFDRIYDSQTELKRWYTTTSNSLRCCVTATPVPDVIWYRNGHLLTFGTNRRSLQNNGQVLWLSDIRMTDKGNYTCIAKNVHGSVSHSFLVKITSTFVLQKPVVILQPGPWKTYVGNNVTISCTIMKSTRPPQVMWFHRFKNTTKFCIGEKYHIAPLESKEKETWVSTLTILNVTMDDQGNYTCKARNAAGSGLSANQTGTLIVQELNVEASPQQEEESLFTKYPAVLGVIIATVGVSLLFVILLSFLCWRRKSRSEQTTDFPINDQSFPKHDYNPLSLNGGEDRLVEIPTENLQLLRRAPGTDRDNNVDFDVFVSYSSMDRDFVKNVLYAELTTTHSVCIDFKDFEAGLFIPDNIANSVFRSRKTLLVITRNFLKGVWTFFEMQLAQGRLAEGHDVLILVLVEDIPVHELPKALQHYRQTKTYLEYFNEDVRPHFWDRLRSAIGPSLRQEIEKDKGVD